MTVDVSALLDEADNKHRNTCATCTWLRSRPEGERSLWVAELSRSREERPHQTVVRAITKAGEMTKSKLPAPNAASVAKHRADGHTV